MTHSSVDITIPVLNEERTIEGSLRTLAAYLSAECPYDWCITVVDNGSTDQTWRLANSFAATNPQVRAIRLDQRGRGGALKAAWSTSTAEIVAYMDVDLSTGLEALQPLLDPIVRGETDISIGSRLASGARIERSLQREVISRIYNVIARTFQAIRSSLARDLIPRIEDDGWFFDTELLVLAWRSGLRINEVPVRWVEDDDSRVRIVRTALDDLRGIWRLFRARANVRSDRCGIPCPDGRASSRSQDAKEEERGVDFDAHAVCYEEAVDQSVSFTRRDSAFFAGRKVEVLETIVRAEIGPLQDLSVLDVGCGTGTTDRLLMPRARSLHGVDISEEMLIKARANVPSAEFTWYDGEKLPFVDNTFDVVMAICVLHHVPVSRRFKFVNEMVRVARSGGVVVIFEHNPLNPLTRHAVNSCELDQDAVLLQSRETTELLREAAESKPRLRHYLFSPFGGSFGRALDQGLQRLPLGGQYVAWVQRPHAPHR
jgi:ubiquinone/menaquinone biosynthesis C-methylase UbiE